MGKLLPLDELRKIAQRAGGVKPTKPASGMGSREHKRTSQGTRGKSGIGGAKKKKR